MGSAPFTMEAAMRKKLLQHTLFAALAAWALSMAQGRAQPSTRADGARNAAPLSETVAMQTTQTAQSADWR